MAVMSLKICFVCLGNICRSPTAEAVMKHLVKQAGLERVIQIESAGTGDWHVGEPRDRRSQQTALARGVPLAGRAQHFTAADFERFDYVIAMDGSNLADLRQMAPGPEALAKLSRLRAGDGDVPDPYYGGAHGFEEVFDICQAACAELLARLRSEHGL
jgi:protein-tyrosine phosphatase